MFPRGRVVVALFSIAACGWAALTALRLPSDVIRGPARVFVDAASACALWDDGAMRCWGDGVFVPYDSPHWLWQKGERPWAKPSPRANVRELAYVPMRVHGEEGACVITLAGELECTAIRLYPRFPDYRWSSLPAVQSAPEMRDVRSPVAGARRVCAIAHGSDAASDAVWCLTRAPVADKHPPVVRSGWERVELGAPRALAFGGDTLCALGTDGKVRCEQGGAVREIPGIDSAVQIALGTDFGCARTADGRVWCWGDNESGQLGDGSQFSSPEARPVALDAPATDLSVWDARACVLSNGAPWCWGVVRPEGSLPAIRWREPRRAAPIDGLRSLSISYAFACGIRASDGTVWCWGTDTAGQLGNGSALPMGGCSREGISGTSPERERLAPPTPVRTGEAGGYPQARGPIAVLLAALVLGPLALLCRRRDPIRRYAGLLLATLIPVFATRFGGALLAMFEHACRGGWGCDDGIDPTRSSTPLVLVLLAISFGIVAGVERAVAKANDVGKVARRASWWVTFGAVPLLLAAMSCTRGINEQLAEDLAYRLRDATWIWWRAPFVVQWVWTVAWIVLAIAFGAYVRKSPKAGSS